LWEATVGAKAKAKAKADPPPAVKDDNKKAKNDNKKGWQQKSIAFALKARRLVRF